MIATPELMIEAYNRWVGTFPANRIVPSEIRTHGQGRFAQSYIVKPHWDGECCPMENHYIERDNQDGTITLVPAPDDHIKVCARELAWRQYCRLRDELMPERTRRWGKSLA